MSCVLSLQPELSSRPPKTTADYQRLMVAGSTLHRRLPSARQCGRPSQLPPRVCTRMPPCATMSATSSRCMRPHRRRSGESSVSGGGRRAQCLVPRPHLPAESARARPSRRSSTIHICRIAPRLVEPFPTSSKAKICIVYGAHPAAAPHLSLHLPSPMDHPSPRPIFLVQALPRMR